MRDRPGDDPSEFVIDEVAGQWLALLFPAAALWSRGFEGWLPWPAPVSYTHLDVYKRQVFGGATRAASVRNALIALQDQGITHVLIHDGARPLVSQAVIARVLAALADAPGAAPALAVTDALWTGQDGRVTGSRDRQGLYLSLIHI